MEISFVSKLKVGKRVDKYKYYLVRIPASIVRQNNEIIDKYRGKSVIAKINGIQVIMRVYQTSNVLAISTISLQDENVRKQIEKLVGKDVQVIVYLN